MSDHQSMVSLRLSDGLANSGDKLTDRPPVYRFRTIEPSQNSFLRRHVPGYGRVDENVAVVWPLREALLARRSRMFDVGRPVLCAIKRLPETGGFTACATRHDLLTHASRSRHIGRITGKLRGRRLPRLQDMSRNVGIIVDCISARRWIPLPTGSRQSPVFGPCSRAPEWNKLRTQREIPHSGSGSDLRRKDVHRSAGNERTR